MKKFVARVERAVLKVVVSPEFRPLEREVASRLARSILVRVGASAAVSGLVFELISKFLA